jgi:glycosyltransferase involved in cell wall biosynthesis
MKLAIHSPIFSTHVGGTERLIADYIPALSHHFDVTLVTASTERPSTLFRQVQENVRTVLLPGTEERGMTNPFDSNDPLRWHFEGSVFGPEACGFYAQSDINLVATHFATDSLYVPHGVKNVLHLHGTPSSHSEIGELSTRRPDAFICVSEYVRSTWRRMYSHLAAAQMEVVYSHVDAAKYAGASERDIDVLYTGRLIRIKGVDHLLRALSSTPARAVIIGTGPEESRLRHEALALGIDAEFRGFVPDRELRDAYARAKVAVFPSYAKEGVMVTMLEAAASGCAIVTTDSCSMPEFVRHGSNGLLARPEDPDSLAECIRILLQDAALRRSLGEQAMSDVSSWNLESRVQRIREIYEVTHG